MNNKNLHLFVIDGNIENVNYKKVERVLQDVLSWNDMIYLACCHEIKDNKEIFVCCFSKKKIDTIEKQLNKLKVIIKSEDISKETIKSNYCDELKLILEDNPSNKIIIENFILENINLDIILDKICYQGLESINKIEKKYLENL